MKSFLNMLSNIRRFHKMKIVVLFVFIVVFLLALFPFDDLNDLMTTKVMEKTAGQVYVQADTLGIHWLPTPGVKLFNALLQVEGLPNIESDELTVSPSLLSALRAAVGAELNAVGLFKGKVDINYDEGSRNKDGPHNQKIKIEASDIALSSLSAFIRDMGLGDFKLGGALNILGQAKFDQGLEEQPTANLELSLKSFVFPAYVIYMGGAPMFPLPELKFKRSSIKTALSEGKMQVNELSLGDEKDDLSCSLHGEIAVKMVKGRPTPDLGAYSFNVEMNVMQKFYDQNSNLFGLLNSSFKKQMPGGQKFKFKISGDSLMSPPRMTDF